MADNNKEEIVENDNNNTGVDQSTLPPPIQYCGVCGLPPEYCEYGPNFEKCKPWLREHCPALYSAETLQEQKPAVGEDGKEKKKDEDVKLLPGGKVKKKEKPVVHIATKERTKKKFVTEVKGLEKFGVKLPDAAKQFAKKFSCGASVIKGEKGIDDKIDIQGDVADDLIDFIAEKFEISEDDMVVEDPPKKKG